MVQILESKADYDTCIESNPLVVIDYFAEWCGPCKVIAPKIEALEQKFTNVKFAKVDVDKNSETSEAAGISAMPTFHFFKNGKKVGEVVGASEAKIVEAIEKLVA